MPTFDNGHPYPTPLLPTAYFPPVAYMAALTGYAHFAIEQHETFPKQTHRNRTVIVTAAGPMTLSVPVVRPDGNHTRTADIGISYAEHWNLIHLRAIESAYNASPFYEYYREGIATILLQRHCRLLDLNEAILRFLLHALKMECHFQATDEFTPPSGASNDYRGRFSYKHPDPDLESPTYYQVFSDRMAFQPNVGILDLLFNLGPEAKDYLVAMRDKNHGL